MLYIIKVVFYYGQCDGILQLPLSICFKLPFSTGTSCFFHQKGSRGWGWVQRFSCCIQKFTFGNTFAFVDWLTAFGWFHQIGWNFCGLFLGVSEREPCYINSYSLTASLLSLVVVSSITSSVCVRAAHCRLLTKSCSIRFWVEEKMNGSFGNCGSVCSINTLISEWRM